MIFCVREVYYAPPALNHMLIDSADLVPLLEELSMLPSAQQQVFLFCLTLERGVVYLHSPDIQMIALALGFHARTVQRALFFIRNSKVLSKCVSIRRRKDEKIPDHVRDGQAIS